MPDLVHHGLHGPPAPLELDPAPARVSQVDQADGQTVLPSPHNLRVNIKRSVGQFLASPRS